MIIYAKNSNYRKEKYRLTTTIEKKTNGLLVRKKINQNVAKDHLFSIVEKYEKIKPYFKEIQVVEPYLADNTLIFPYIEGDNLLGEFIRHYLNDDEDSAIGVLYEFKKLIDNLASVDYDVGTNEEFVKVFGKSSTGKEKCVKIGCLDLNLDNFIRKSGKIYLIDYEWVFDTPLPKDFLYFRTLLASYAAIKELLENRFSDNYSIVHIWPGVLIPKKIYDKELPSFSRLKKFYAYETNFQSYVNEFGDSKPVKFYKPKVLTESTASNVFNYTNHLENTIKNLQDVVKIRDEEIQNIYNSKAWKTAMKLKKIKRVLVPNKSGQ